MFICSRPQPLNINLTCIELPQKNWTQCFWMNVHKLECIYNSQDYKHSYKLSIKISVQLQPSCILSTSLIFLLIGLHPLIAVILILLTVEHCSVCCLAINFFWNIIQIMSDVLLDNVNSRKMIVGLNFTLITPHPCSKVPHFKFRTCSIKQKVIILHTTRKKSKSCQHHVWDISSQYS